MKNASTGFADDLTNWGRGLLIGGVDIIPGVSGGTVALLLGIYPRLLTSLSRIDRDFLGLVIRGQWRAAAHHIDLRFLVALGLGIGSGILLLAGVINFLLAHHRQLTMATFFGLILGSAVIVLRMIKPQRREQYALCFGVAMASAVGAAMLMLSEYLDPRPGLLYVFLCGVIAICAMILPGVSGAYVLIMLGKYEDITDILHRLKAGDVTPYELLTLVVFSVGCAVGLIGFSKILRALLHRYHLVTMTVLGGFMIGSLVKIWPFQTALVPGEEIDSRTKTVPAWPEVWDSHAWLCIAAAVAACGLIVGLDQLANRKQAIPAKAGSDRMN